MAGLYRTLGIFGGFLAVVGVAFYPIYFRPLLLPEEYTVGDNLKRQGINLLRQLKRFIGRQKEMEKQQSINRAGVVQEDIQPAGLKVWSDPFGRK
ncbi:small integral membrane protein 20 isoform 1-T1 [Porphyrio hochstetteri]